MSLFNYNAQEIHCKIIYYGPAGSGKTTNIKWICRNTLAQDLDHLSIPLQTESSAFFDFLPLDVGTIRGLKTRLHIYTFPGGELFETSQALLLKGVDGIIFVADAQKEKMSANQQALNQLQNLLKAEGISLDQIPMVIQYNKMDKNETHSLTELRTMLNHHNKADFPAVASKGQGVFETLKTLSKIVIAVLKGGKLQ